jgi:hypothetical protein
MRPRLRVSCLVPGGRWCSDIRYSPVCAEGEPWQIGDAYKGMDLTMTTLPADDVVFDAEAYKLAIKKMRKVRHTSAGAPTNVKPTQPPSFLFVDGGMRRARCLVHEPREADEGAWAAGGRGDHLHT